jgi:hypothetical protein
MKKTLTLIVAAVLTASSCQNGKTETMERKAYDTVFVRDTVVVHDTIVLKDEKYYDGKWLKRKFETCEWKLWESYDYHFVVRHPVFMQMDESKASTSGVCFEYKGVRLLAKAYKDKVDMSVEQKYKELSQSANTKSVKDNYFLIAGKMGEEDCYFEKDIKIDGCWYYIRAEFPQAFTSSIDALLQYVKEYNPFAYSPYVKQ